MAGTVEVNLKTSKAVIGTPIVKYSFDGEEYKPLALEGSSVNWKGYVVIEDDFGEGVLSFKFEAVDLEGRHGSFLSFGNVFEIDTISPKMILDFEGVLDDDEIKLEWHSLDKVNKVKIYKSESPNPTYSDYFKTVSGKTYIDKHVDDGKRYYYKIAGVDSAGNEGPLSSEVFVVTVEDSESKNVELRPALLGRVNGFLNELSFVKSEVASLINSVNSKEKSEKELFKRMKFDSVLENSKSELTSLESLAERYKLQDLEEEDLNRKLESLRMKMSVVEKKLPEKINFIDSASRKEIFTSDSIERGLTKFDLTISEDEIEKSIEETLGLIDENNLVVRSEFNHIQVVYSDGTKKDYIVVERFLDSTLERLDSSKFLEIFSGNLLNDIDSVVFGNLNYDFLSEDVISFGSDTKNIFYYFPGSSIYDAKKSEVIFISKVDSESKNSRGITGNAIFGLGEINNPIFIGGPIIILVLLFYFLHSRKKNMSRDYLDILKLIQKANDCLESKNYFEAKKIYTKITKEYSLLHKNEKEYVYSKIENIHNKILLNDLMSGLVQLEKTKDEKLLVRMEKIYSELPSDLRVKIQPILMGIKARFSNKK